MCTYMSSNTIAIANIILLVIAPLPHSKAPLKIPMHNS